jgi:uncharacterized surface protein with fasciclin (FAS1) repeats
MLINYKNYLTMKNVFQLPKIALFLFLAVFATSCDNTTTDPVTELPKGTIVDIAVSDTQFSSLVAALTKANLVTTLKGAGPFTVFAPTNDAFVAFLKANNFKTLDDVPVATLKEVLLNHVVSGTVLSTKLSTGYIKTLASGPNDTKLSMFVNTKTGVQLNGVAKVSKADVLASNGVIHVVDNVIGLPTIVTHAVANPSFTSLVGALTGAEQPKFTEILAGKGPFTVFAPTNDAFTALNTELAPGGIAGVSAANLTKVLKYHVVSGANVLAASLKEGQVVTTFADQDFTVQLAGGAKILDASKRTSNITATDVQCANGVIHVLDKVLLPKL